jgi:cysteinyl-tRNA synthetase
MQKCSSKTYFFNTLTRKKEKFTPISNAKVGMYTCGLTVYDFGHIGNMRAFVFEDVLRRWLEYCGFKVTHVMNITDVDDRTIHGSTTHKKPLNEYTEQYIKAFYDDIAKLNIEKADYYPRATGHIPEMVALVKTLLDKGYAYKANDGSIYYNVRKFKNYGKLSKLKLKKLKARARVKVDEYAKEEASDFALWKAWDESDGDVYWETEIGKGRPGWHIECSAMSMKYLGETFDIHCGGIDNMFPHHENEIAQSEAATGKKFVNYWLHNEHLLVEGRRMAKRLGNYYTVRDLTSKGYDSKAIRYLMLSTHYRQQLNFTFDGLAAAENATERVEGFMRRLSEADGSPAHQELENLMEQARTTFENAMSDDLNVSVALGGLFDLIRGANSLMDKNAVSKDEAKLVRALIIRFDKVLGIIGEVKAEAKLLKHAEELMRQREEARKARDWEAADKLRQELKTMGVIVEDTPQGVRWRIEEI